MNRFIKIIILPIFLLLSSCGIYNYYKITKVKDSSYTIGPSSTQEFPFEIVNNRIIISVFIQDRKYNFLFDTGASLVLDSQLLNEIEFENIARVKVTDANEKSESLKYIKLSEVRCFAASFRDQAAIVMDLTDAVRNSCINISGIFGASIMKDLIWQINFDKNSIKVSDNIQNLKIDSSSIKIPFDNNSSQSPIIDLNIDGHQEKIIVDTGSGATFSLPKRYIDELSEDKSLTAFSRFSGVFGNTLDTVYYLPKSIGFNPFYSEKWDGVVEVRNSLNEALVGIDFLKDYQVTMDWINQNLYLKQINFERSEWSTYGIDVMKSDSNVIVSEVYTGSKAHKAGIKLGDIISKIDEFNFIDATEMRICDFINQDYLNTNDSTIRIKINSMENYLMLEKEAFFE